MNVINTCICLSANKAARTLEEYISKNLKQKYHCYLKGHMYPLRITKIKKIHGEMVLYYPILQCNQEACNCSGAGPISTSSIQDSNFPIIEFM